jgi:UDP-glucose 4-epimerase
MRPKNTLVTGGAGFIGSHLCEALLAKGDRVTVIDDLSTGRKENIAPLIGRPDFLFFENSIMNKGLMDHLVREADEIYHLAAVVGVQNIVDDPIRTLHTIIVGTDTVFELAHKHGEKRIFLASTSEVYGKSPNCPYSEEDDRVLGSTTRNRWSYSSAKAVDEYIALAYNHKHKLPVVIGRLFNTVGPRQTGQYGMVLPRFVKQALMGETITVYGDGAQSRTFSYVHDVVEAVIKLMDSPETMGQIFNIGSEEEVTIMELAERVKRITGANSYITPTPYEEAYGEGFEDMLRRVPNIEKIRKTIGFEPKTKLDDIIRAVAGWIAETGRA